MQISFFPALAQLALVASVVNAEQPTGSRKSSSTTATNSATGTVNAAATTQACASVSSLLSSYASANPSPTILLAIPAELAYDCSRSAPVVKEDALNLVDGLSAFLEWQSTLAYLKNPPEGYLLAPVDLIGGMKQLRDQVSAGAFSSEIDFQTNLTSLIGQAHDGHLLFLADALNVFIYERSNLGQLVSISEDGTSIPQVYVLGDLTAAAAGLNTTWSPSPVTMMDGQNVTERLSYMAENTTISFQDPDAMYNALFASLASGDGAFFGTLSTYTGPSTSLVFANGTTQTYQNNAYTRKDFTGVSSGPDFYNLCCNVTAKLEAPAAAATTAAATSAVPTATAAVTATGYPSPVVSSPDGSIAGYFLSDTGFENTAVLAITQETETDPLGAQTALTQFLDACRKNSKETLVIDIQSNPGGSILLGYDFFKQLFPSLEPYAAGNMRAQPQLNVLGSFYTTVATQEFEEEPGNYNDFENSGGYSFFDAATSLDEAGNGFQSWSALYGPRADHGDYFTNVIRRNVSDPNYDEQATGFGIVVSGYGNRSDLAPQPFKSENMILLTDGQCSSTCTTFGHMMKWQGKVKSITMGGRPQNGPIQYIGGVKGNQVYNLPQLGEFVFPFYANADHAAIETANTTGLKTLADLGEYVQLRSAYPTGAESTSAVSFNLMSSIAEGDETSTPLQFVYEAADCRLWWMAGDLVEITNLWKRVAANAFGLNGNKIFGQCVSGSTDAPSSLSGNQKLFNGGKINNVTTFENDQLPDSSSSASSSASGGGSASATSSGSSSSSTAAANGAIKTGGSASALLAMIVLGLYVLA